ncbi:MAG: AAA family ATPase, partial [Caldisericaceae bacterium]|nr:AAA family ATPase [Caldisericaceae bacterium]
MISSDSHFFTNEEGATVLERLKKILSHDTEYFNAIVGYFYSTGFHKLWKSLEDVKKIKILVGMGIDKATFDTLFPTGETALETRRQFINRVKSEVAAAAEKKEVEQGVIKFIEYIEKGKLEIRAYPGKSLHAKVYIMLKKEGAEDLGKVITGSSNFSASGLDENIEFNIELKDAPDIKFAQQKFEELWKQSIPVSDAYIQTVTEHTHLNNKFTPYEIYLKTLYEYFKDIVNYDLKDIDVPEEYKQLKYQTDAVFLAKSKLESHNGVFLADVVGMGKTYIASMLAKEMNMPPLIICPPRLKTYWEETMHSFGVIPKVWSSGSLDKLIDQENLNKYPIVFIDEAHKFRNADTKTYGVLHEICAGKKVVLVSATPLNNKPMDIASQIFLFENKYNSTIPNLSNLATFFTHLQQEYEEIKKKYKANPGQTTSVSLSDIKCIANKMRNNVLQHIMIRRTRADVKYCYEEDMKKQNLTFPEIADPALALYQLDTELNNLFDKSVKIMESPRDKKTSDKLFYARYMPLSYLKENGIKYLLDSKQVESLSDINFLEMSEALLVGLMRTFFLKRLDSSFAAFKNSLDNIIVKCRKM